MRTPAPGPEKDEIMMDSNSSVVGDKEWDREQGEASAVLTTIVSSARTGY
jgi:hypothetical protein